MAYDKVINCAKLDADLTAVANAIRTKGGTYAPLGFPSGFIGAVQGLQVGGGTYTDEQILALVARSITEFTIPDGATYIGTGAFYGCQSLVTLHMPDTVTTIRDNAFAACIGLVMEELPDAVASIGQNAFSSNGGCKYLRRLPAYLRTIAQNAFAYSTDLTISEIPAQVQTIGNYAFRQCTGLTALTFRGTPASISSNVFTNCSNLLTINVPWANGAVANAPWGATNATINYNYSGG